MNITRIQEKISDHPTMQYRWAKSCNPFVKDTFKGDLGIVEAFFLGLEESLSPPEYFRVVVLDYLMTENRLRIDVLLGKHLIESIKFKCPVRGHASTIQPGHENAENARPNFTKFLRKTIRLARRGSAKTLDRDRCEKDGYIEGEVAFEKGQYALSPNQFRIPYDRLIDSNEKIIKEFLDKKRCSDYSGETKDVSPTQEYTARGWADYDVSPHCADWRR